MIFTPDQGPGGSHHRGDCTECCVCEIRLSQLPSLSLCVLFLFLCALLCVELGPSQNHRSPKDGKVSEIIKSPINPALNHVPKHHTCSLSEHFQGQGFHSLPSQPLLMPGHPFGEDIFPDNAAVSLQDPSLAFQGCAIEAASLWLPDVTTHSIFPVQCQSGHHLAMHGSAGHRTGAAQRELDRFVH